MNNYSALEFYIEYVTRLVESVVGPITEASMEDEFKRLEDAGAGEFAKGLRERVRLREQLRNAERN